MRSDRSEFWVGVVLLAGWLIGCGLIQPIKLAIRASGPNDSAVDFRGLRAPGRRAEIGKSVVVANFHTRKDGLIAVFDDSSFGWLPIRKMERNPDSGTWRDAQFVVHVNSAYTKYALKRALLAGCINGDSEIGRGQVSGIWYYNNYLPTTPITITRNAYSEICPISEVKRVCRYVDLLMGVASIDSSSDKSTQSEEGGTSLPNSLPVPMALLLRREF